MPRIAEIREIEDEIWVRIGKVGEFPDGVTIWSAEEVIKHYDDAFEDGKEEARSDHDAQDANES